MSYFSAFLKPEINGIIPLFGLFFPLIVALNIGFILFWLMTKKVYSLLSITALLLGFNPIQKLVSFDSDMVIKSPNILRVMTYNVASGLFVKKNEKKAFYQFINDHYENGVLLLQESSAKIIQTLEKQFPEENFVRVKESKVVIMSHFPILKSDYIKFDNPYNSCVWADLKIKNKIIRVYAVHLQSNKITKIANEVTSQIEVDNKKVWKNIKKMMNRYSSSTIKRETQLQEILTHIKKTSHPVILAGDFNDVPQSFLYSQVSKVLKDSFREKGFGLGRSFNGSIPALRIDYIFGSEEFRILNFKTWKVPYSDHYPLTSEFLLK
jgi:endonuclease/exonuclease/phosphatase family metal-dependent hydrolase